MERASQTENREEEKRHWQLEMWGEASAPQAVEERKKTI